ncbi:hypothetical protein SAY87_013714 [Trapa incisa]|uniref:Uncharacterized protein n=1 Tax=Trapa incisa TaxID=236973 RepID=A0AAN7KCD3_9MYRT|nr:hypothetical protein SAY87_013714 [Trapa incisa]
MDSFKTRMEGKLNRVDKSPQKSYIFKVHHLLHKVNEKAYSPVLISIGPYHYERRKLDLQFMEQHKWRYLNDMIRRKESSEDTSRDDLLGRCFKILEEHEARARGYYAEAVPLGKEEFIEMMLVDSCFIIEYFWKCESPERWEDDPLFQADWIGNCLSRDLVLIENQVPFLVLTKLLSVIGPWPDQDQDDLAAVKSLVLAAVKYLPIYQHLGPIQGKIARNFAVESFPRLVQQGIFKNDGKIMPRINLLWISRDPSTTKERENLNIKHLLDLVRKFMLIDETLLINSETTHSVNQQPQRDQDEEAQKPIHSASKLREFGVQFKGVDNRKFYDIKFEKGVLQIPVLLIDDGAECYFRNIIAYEQHAGDLSARVSDYMYFMDNLIDSSKDVELLRREGIINSFLGDDTEIATMINKMGSNITIKQDYYEKVRNDLSKHCKQRRHSWIASLRMNYLSSPWTILSTIAAIILLLLTLMQTIYTTLSYYHA